MKVKITRDSPFINISNVVIEINGCIYRLSETIDGRLTVNKISIDGNDDCIKVHPRSGNEIDLS